MAKILIVDDEPLICEMLGTFLKVLGHESLKAHSGAQARTVLATEQPDAIFLDIMLPEISGIDFCRELRSRPGTSDVPIVVISACAPPQTREAMEAGANAYLQKPVNLQGLQNIMATAGIATAGRVR